MKRPVLLVLVAAVIGLGVWGWRVWFPSPQNVIRSRLLKLASTMSFEPSQGVIPKGLKAKNLGEYFAVDVVVSLEVRGFEAHTLKGRDEVAQAAMLAMQRLAGLKVEFVDINVSLAAGGETAEASLTGKATIEGESDYQVQEFSFKLKKIEGTWLVYQIETVKTLG
jgi:hypothetical protein